MLQFYHQNKRFCAIFYAEPASAFEKWDEAVVLAQRTILCMESQNEALKLKPKVHVRLRVSQVPPLWSPSLPRSSDIGRFMMISGTVVRYDISLVFVLSFNFPFSYSR